MPAAPQSGVRYFALVLLFCISGMAGLGYQVLWGKQFAAGAGHEFPAVLAVITAFMGGMALGSAAIGAWRRNLSAQRGAYGWLELIIAVWAAASFFLIPKANSLIIAALGAEPGFARHWLTVFVLVFLILLPATAAMGATLAAMERFTAAVRAENSVGLLYGANTFGAVLGILLTAFWLMPSAGIASPVLVLAVLNLLCGGVALVLAKSQNTPVSSLFDKNAPLKTPLSIATPLFFTGLLGIAYETAAIRALSHVLENTVFTFAAVLAIYLLGTSAGAFAYSFPRINRARSPILFAALAASTLAGALLLWIAEPLYAALRQVLGVSMLQVALAEMIVTATVVALPSFLMGAVFSYLAESARPHVRNLGGPVALNLLGGSIAPALVGLVIIPSLGLKAAFILITAGYSLLIPGRCKFAIVPLLALGLLFPGTADLIHRADSQRIIFLREGVMASVAVLEDTNSQRVLKVNNRFQMGGTAARIAEQRQADIPLLLHPLPKTALFLGLGSGITFNAASFHPALQAHGVELVPEILEAMPLFHDGTAGLNSATTRIFVADARRFVAVTTNLYDVIVADLFHPAQDGAGFLYSREHFLAMKKRLQPGGVLCQWLPLHQLDLDLLKVITRTFLEVFPNAEAWLLRFSAETPVIGLVSRPQPVFSAEWVEQRLASPALDRHLRRVALVDSLRLFGCFLAGPEQLQIFSASSELNTDLFPRVLFQAPAFSFRQSDDPARRILELIDSLSSPPLSDSGAFSVKLEQFINARNVYFTGLAAEAAGDTQAAVTAFLESARLSPDFTAGYAQCLYFASALARNNPDAAKSLLQQLITVQPERSAARDLLNRLFHAPE